jgi:hypothetical protein
MLVETLAARGIAYVLLKGDLPHRMRQVEALLG